jgi:hypothetical protein
MAEIVTQGYTDSFAPARAARQRKLRAAGTATGGTPPDSCNYAAKSTHPNNPYSPRMRESDAVVAAAVARLEARPADAGSPVAAAALIEHRATGRRRYYPVSPIGQEIMSRGSGAAGNEYRPIPGVGNGPTGRAQHQRRIA